MVGYCAKGRDTADLHPETHAYTIHKEIQIIKVGVCSVKEIWYRYCQFILDVGANKKTLDYKYWKCLFEIS